MATSIGISCLLYVVLICEVRRFRASFIASSKDTAQHSSNALSCINLTLSLLSSTRYITLVRRSYINDLDLLELLMLSHWRSEFCTTIIYGF